MGRLIPAGRGASAAACGLCPCGHIAKCSRYELAKRHETHGWRMFQNLGEIRRSVPCVGAGGYGRGASRLAAAKRRLLRAAALGALASSGALTGVDAAWGQVSETLPEVTVSAPRPVPRPPRRPTPAPRRAASSAPT